LLAARGIRIDDETNEAELARAYAGAVIQYEAIAEIKALRRDIVSLVKALTVTR